MQGSKTCSTQPSRVVPHRSTTWARPCLTALFGWEAVTQGEMAACDPTTETNIYRYYIFCEGDLDVRVNQQMLTDRPTDGHTDQPND